MKLTAADRGKCWPETLPPDYAEILETFKRVSKMEKRQTLQARLKLILKGKNK